MLEGGTVDEIAAGFADVEHRRPVDAVAMRARIWSWLERALALPSRVLSAGLK